MMVILFNGQSAPTGGWYVDGHGHRMFLGEGDLAPICSFSGAAAVQWRLVQAIPTLRR